MQPNDPDLLYEQAMLAERADKIEEMEALLRKLIALGPDHHHAYNALGYLLADRGLKLDEAKSLIEKGAQHGAWRPLHHRQPGWVEYKQGNLEQAAQLLEKAYTKQPDPEIGAHLAEVWWKQGKSKPAEELLRAARKDAPDNEKTVLKTFKLLGIAP